jgi:hypothetical protein
LLKPVAALAISRVISWTRLGESGAAFSVLQLETKDEVARATNKKCARNGLRRRSIAAISMNPEAAPRGPGTEH